MSGGGWKGRSSCGGRSCREEFEVEAKVGLEVARPIHVFGRREVVFVLADCAPLWRRSVSEREQQRRRTRADQQRRCRRCRRRRRCGASDTAASPLSRWTSGRFFACCLIRSRCGCLPTHTLSRQSWQPHWLAWVVPFPQAGPPRCTPPAPEPCPGRRGERRTTNYIRRATLCSICAACCGLSLPVSLLCLQAAAGRLAGWAAIAASRRPTDLVTTAHQPPPIGQHAVVDT